MLERKFNGKLFKNNLPSDKWFVGFLKTHSEVRLRVPEHLEEQVQM